MALKDILVAIVAEADRQIADVTAQHERTVREAQTKAKEDVARMAADLETQKDRKCEQLKRKTQQRAEQMKRNAVLQRKRELLDAVYASVLQNIAKEPDHAVEPLLVACLAKAGEGEIRPAKRHAALLKKLASASHTVGDPIDAQGGFLCVSKTREHDFRFETIVSDILRPQTELSVSETLFPAA